MRAAELFDVAGLVTIVTGGASGIGYACAEVMVDNGARVTLLDRDPAALDDAVDALNARAPEPGSVRGEVIDVTDRPALRRAIAESAAQDGGLDVVFANAGIGGGPGFLLSDRTRHPDRALEDLPDELVDRLLSTNFLSVFATIQAAVPHLKARGGGRIIVTSSISTAMPEIHVGQAYVLSKAGLPQLVRQAALELVRYDILVNAMGPGPIVTNISGGRLHDPEIQAFFARYSPMHRMGRPQDLQGLALFLASPASAYITGQHIMIDGGVTLGTAD